jgi:hypothetical protein
MAYGPLLPKAGERSADCRNGYLSNGEPSLFASLEAIGNHLYPLLEERHGKGGQLPRERESGYLSGEPLKSSYLG